MGLPMVQDAGGGEVPKRPLLVGRLHVSTPISYDQHVTGRVVQFQHCADGKGYVGRFPIRDHRPLQGQIIDLQNTHKQIRFTSQTCKSVADH